MRTMTKLRGRRRDEARHQAVQDRPLPLSDEQLIAAARSGDRDAFGELWRAHQHAVSALTYPLAFADTEDTVSEAFTAVWDQLQRGKGPTAHFRAYVVSVSRNIAARRYHERQRTLVNGSIPEGTPVAGSDELSEHGEENRDIIAAFASLPERWQQVLWWQEVEERPRAEIAARLNLSPNSVSALTRRAREGLRLEWLRQQLPQALAPEHRETVQLLPQYVRGAVTTAQSHSVRAHLLSCAGCTDIEVGLQRENHKLGRKIAAGGALAIALGGTLSADMWAAPTAASASAIHAASTAGAANGLTAGGPAGELWARAVRSVVRNANRVGQAASSGGAGAVAAGTAAVGAAAVAVAVGVGGLVPEPALTPSAGPPTGSSEYATADTRGHASSERSTTTSQRDGALAQRVRPAPQTTGDGRAETLPVGQVTRPTSQPTSHPEGTDRPPTSEPPENPDPPVTPEPPEPPGEPEKPEKPTNPENPQKPEKPEKPSRPENPTTPERPTDPEVPTEPEVPSVPHTLTVQRSDLGAGTIAPQLVGRAAPLASVRVEVSGQEATTTATAEGDWALDLAATTLPAGEHVAHLTQWADGAPAGNAEFPFALGQPSGDFALSFPQGPDGIHATRLVAQLSGQPLAEVCVWSSRMPLQRVALDAQGAGSLQVRVSELSLWIEFAYCTGDRMGVSGSAPLSYRD